MKVEKSRLVLSRGALANAQIAVRRRWAGVLAIPIAASLVAARTASAIAYRSDESDTTAKNLALQPQFDGVGIVTGPAPDYAGGDGVAIASNWILTARHVVIPTGSSTTATFLLGGQTYSGTVITDSHSDLALIHLSTSLPASVSYVSINASLPETNQQIWNAGTGGWGPWNSSQTYTYPDGKVRAGTNVIAASESGGFLVQNNSNTSADATDSEATPAWGDSGSPMFMQHDNNWYITGIVYGVSEGVGFIDTPTAENFSFISSTTGLTFSAPTPSYSMMWAPLAGVGTNTGGSGTWDITATNFTSGTHNYAWDNSLAQDVTFGSSTLAAGIVTINPTYLKGGAITAAGVTVHNITFDDPKGNGAFNIAAGTLPSGSAGGTALGQLTFTTSGNSPGNPTITTNWNATISAPIATAGGLFLVKGGPGTLGLSGNSTNFDGVLQISEGAVDAQNAACLGAGGFSDSDSTYVLSGATLKIDGGYTTNEHIHLNGAGASGQGALYNASGNNTLTDPVSLDSAATIGVATGSTLTISGQRAGTAPPGQIYGGNALILKGGGTLSLEGSAHISSLTLNGGTLAQGASGLINSAASLTISGGNYGLGENGQSVAAATLSSGTLSVDLNDHAVAGTAGGNGLLTATALTLDSVMAIAIAPGASFGPGTYDLISYSTLTNASGNFQQWTITGLPAADHAQLALGTDGGSSELQLVVSTPEPALSAAWTVAAGLLLLHRRKRRALCVKQPHGHLPLVF